VTGRVVDSVTGEGVGQALVRAVPRSDTATAPPAVREAPAPPRDEDRRIRTAAITDSAGAFGLVLEPGEYAFQVEHISYRALTTGEVEVADGERLTVEIRLGPLPFEIEPLVVQARAQAASRISPFQRRMEQMGRASMGRFITREDIERAGVTTVNDLLMRQPGVTLVPVRGQSVVVMTGRGQNCRPTLYFDGMAIARGAGDVDLSSWFHPEMIEGIEIYPTATSAPADMRTEGCGVIAIWSRHDAGNGAPLTWRRVLIATGLIGLILMLGVL
jgi:hypothetical protein